MARITPPPPLPEISRLIHPTGVQAATLTRLSTMASQALTSGVSRGTGIMLPEGMTFTAIAYCSSTTAGAGLTHTWFALYDSAGVLLRQTPNDATATWDASTKRQLSLTSAYTTTYRGLYYVVILTAGTTTPSMTGVSFASAVAGVAPHASFVHSTGATATAPDPITPAATTRADYAELI